MMTGVTSSSHLAAVALLAFVTNAALVGAFTIAQKPSHRRRLLPNSFLAVDPTLITDAVHEYNNLLSAYPLETQSMTGGVLCGAGDVLAQTKEMNNSDDEEEVSSSSVVEEKQRYDPGRSQRFALKGLGGGLIWTCWYHLADGWSAAIYQDLLTQYDLVGLLGDNAETIVRTVSSIALEQFVACPIVYSLWDIPVPALLDGAPLNSLPGNVRGKIGGLLVENAKVWTFVNAIVYNLPLEWRVIAMSIADVGWQSVISSVASKNTNTENAMESEGGADNIDMLAFEYQNHRIPQPMAYPAANTMTHEEMITEEERETQTSG